MSWFVCKACNVVFEWDGYSVDEEHAKHDYAACQSKEEGQQILEDKNKDIKKINESIDMDKIKNGMQWLMPDPEPEAIYTDKRIMERRLPITEGRIIVVGMNATKEIQGDDRTIVDSLIQIIKQKIEGVENIVSDVKLRQLAQFALQHQKDKALALGLEFIRPKMWLAHVKGTGEKTQFNCWAYVDMQGERAWTNEAASEILSKLRELAGLDGITWDSGVAEKIAKTLSRDDHTLQVIKNEAYLVERQNMVIDQTGRYFDIDQGTICSIDPSRQFYETPDLQIPLPPTMNAPDPDDFIRFLNERYGENWEIVRDFFAAQFLSDEQLGQRAKMLFLIGPSRTWKSKTVQLMTKILDASKVATIKMSDIDSDQVFVTARMNGCVLNWCDEQNPNQIKNPDLFKALITMTFLKARHMRTTKDKRLEHRVSLVATMNRTFAFPQNDDDQSLFDRFEFVEALPIPDEPVDWWKLLNTPDELQRILVYLLKRAHEIYQGPSCMKVQDAEEAEVRYNDLRRGPVEVVIDRHCVPADDGVGVEWKRLRQIVKAESGSNMDDKVLISILEGMGYFKQDNQRCKFDKAPDTYIITNSSYEKDRQISLITGLAFRPVQNCPQCKARQRAQERRLKKRQAMEVDAKKAVSDQKKQPKKGTLDTAG